MNYQEQTWKDNESGGTPINANGLNHMETGIFSGNRKFKKMLYIGDSWGKGYYSSAEHEANGLATQLGNLLGVGTVVNLSQSSTGWATTGTGTRNFYQQYSQATAAQKQDVDLIVICGGQNDSSDAALTNAYTNAHSLFEAILSGNPDAEVHVFLMPFSYGRTFGNLDTKVTNDCPILARVYSEVEKAIYATANPNVHNHRGCYRWGWKIGDIDKTWIDDAWHLTANGYKVFAGIMARLIKEGGDYWPTFTGNVQGYTGAGDVTTDQIFESNGYTHVRCYINATGNNAIGLTFRLPGWCVGSISRYIAGSTDAGANVFFAVDNMGSGKDIYAQMSLQGAAIASGKWYFINFSWPAGF